MTHKMRTISSFLVVLLVASPLFAQRPRQALGMVHYLKSKFMGITITYERLEYDRKDNPTGEIETAQAEVVEILIRGNHYMVGLSDDERAVVIFEVSQSGDPDLSRRFRAQKSNELTMKALEAEEFINASISKINLSGSGESDSTFTSILDSGGITQLLDESNDDFAQGEEIIYTDLRTGQRKKGFAIVSSQGVVLDTGAPVSIRFESDEIGFEY